MQSIRVLWKHLCLSSCEATLTKDAPAEEELVEEAPVAQATSGWLVDFNREGGSRRCLASLLAGYMPGCSAGCLPPSCLDDPAQCQTGEKCKQ